MRDQDVVVIGAAEFHPRRELRDAWERRDLLRLIARRHLQVRYKQAILGAAWAVIQPAVTMAVFVLVFGRLARLPTDGMPHAVFYLSALVPWTYFTSSFANATNSLIDNPSLVTRVYIPRVFLPVGAILAGLVDLALGTLLLMFVVLASGIAPSWTMAAALPAAALIVLTLAAFTLWTSALNARYRDVRMIVPFVTQVLLFASPIVYSASLVPERWLGIYYANPLAVAISGFRWSMAGGPRPSLGPSLMSVAFLLVLLVAGLSYFQITTRTIADRV